MFKLYLVGVCFVDNETIGSLCLQVLFDYDGENEDELTLKRGDKIILLSEDSRISGDDGWFVGQYNKKVRAKGAHRLTVASWWLLT